MEMPHYILTIFCGILLREEKDGKILRNILRML